MRGVAPLEADGVAWRRLLTLSATLSEFVVISHLELPVPAYTFGSAPERVRLPAASYYLAGVQSAQRDIYDEHCSGRYAERSPYHYSSVDDLEAKRQLGGDMFRKRSVYDLRGGAFVGLDGLVMHLPNAAHGGHASGAPAAGKLYTFERPPGFNGLGRLLLSLADLRLATLSADGATATLRPSDLTAARFAATYRARGGTLPEERGIENVHAYTYSKTFNASQPDANSPELAAHRCLFVLEQFMTVNYWHWLTDALPKALLYAEMAGEAEGCKVLAYDFPWTRPFLAIVLGQQRAHDAMLPYRPSTLYHACRVLLPFPSALDAPSHAQLVALRGAVLPHAAAAAVAAAAVAAVGTRAPLVLLQLRQGGRGSSVHGAGRALTNLPELVRALRRAFGASASDGSGGSDGSDGGAAASAADEGVEGTEGGVHRRRGAAPTVEVVVFDHRGMSVAEQVALYTRAAVVIGVHGAGFANALWASAGARIVEIVPIDVHLDFQCGLTPFWYVSELLGLRHEAFVAYAGRMFEAFELPLLEFFAFLRAVAILPWRGDPRRSPGARRPGHERARAAEGQRGGLPSTATPSCGGRGPSQAVGSHVSSAELLRGPLDIDEHALEPERAIPARTSVDGAAAAAGSRGRQGGSGAAGGAAGSSRSWEQQQGGRESQD